MRTFLLICCGGYHENYAWTFFCSSVFVSVCVFNVWPKTTLLLPVWPRDATRSDTPGLWVLGVNKLQREILKRHKEMKYLGKIRDSFTKKQTKLT